MTDSTELQELLSVTDRRVAYLNQLEFLKEEYHARRTLIFNGHRFVATVDLLKWVDWALKESIDRDLDTVIILDQNEEPVLIDDIVTFHEEVHSVFHEALNRYYDGYNKLKNSKNLSEIVGAV